MNFHHNLPRWSIQKITYTAEMAEQEDSHLIISPQSIRLVLNGSHLLEWPRRNFPFDVRNYECNLQWSTYPRLKIWIYWRFLCRNKWNKDNSLNFSLIYFIHIILSNIRYISCISSIGDSIVTNILNKSSLI